MPLHLLYMFFAVVENHLSAQGTDTDFT